MGPGSQAKHQGMLYPFFQKRKDSKRFWFAYLKTALNARHWEEFARIKEKINNMIMEDASGYVIIIRLKNNASTEAASLYHTNKEFKNSQKNSLKKIKINGSVVEDDKAIEEEVTQYFHALFNGYHNSSLVNTGSSFVLDYSGLNSYLDGLGTLNDLVRDEMEKNIIMEELRDIVKECGNNKSHGLDGLSY